MDTKVVSFPSCFPPCECTWSVTTNSRRQLLPLRNQRSYEAHVWKTWPPTRGCCHRRDGSLVLQRARACYHRRDGALVLQRARACCHKLSYHRSTLRLLNLTSSSCSFLSTSNTENMNYVTLVLRRNSYLSLTSAQYVPYFSYLPRECSLPLLIVKDV